MIYKSNVIRTKSTKHTNKPQRRNTRRPSNLFILVGDGWEMEAGWNATADAVSYAF